MLHLHITVRPRHENKGLLVWLEVIFYRVSNIFNFSTSETPRFSTYGQITDLYLRHGCDTGRLTHNVASNTGLWSDHKSGLVGWIFPSFPIQASVLSNAPRTLAQTLSDWTQWALARRFQDYFIRFQCSLLLQEWQWVPWQPRGFSQLKDWAANHTNARRIPSTGCPTDQRFHPFSLSFSVTWFSPTVAPTVVMTAQSPARTLPSSLCVNYSTDLRRMELERGKRSNARAESCRETRMNMNLIWTSITCSKNTEGVISRHFQIVAKPCQRIPIR